MRSLGHEPVRVGPTHKLLDRPSIDVAINIAEGGRTRNREGWAPTLLEMLDIPFVGSDALTLSLSLDKAWTKELAQTVGVRVPRHVVAALNGPFDVSSVPFSGPLIVKPRYEGSSKGIDATSVVADVQDLDTVVRECWRRYAQDALVEQFVDGSEFTVAVVGHDPPRALPVLQRAVDRKTGLGVHALERRGLDATVDEWHLPGELTAELEAELQGAALAVFNKLECRDFARADFRVDAAGRPWFLEINPLPTFAPDGTFAIQAELEGREYGAFLADVIGEALDRILTIEERDGVV